MIRSALIGFCLKQEKRFPRTFSTPYLFPLDKGICQLVAEASNCRDRKESILHDSVGFPLLINSSVYHSDSKLATMKSKRMLKVFQRVRCQLCMAPFRPVGLTFILEDLITAGRELNPDVKALQTGGRQRC